MTVMPLDRDAPAVRFAGFVFVYGGILLLGGTALVWLYVALVALFGVPA